MTKLGLIECSNKMADTLYVYIIREFDQVPIAEPVPAAGVEEEKQMEPPPNAAPAQPKPMAAVVPSKKTGPTIPAEAFKDVELSQTQKKRRNEKYRSVILNSTDKWRSSDLDHLYISRLRREVMIANPEIPDDITDQELDTWVDNYIHTQ